MLEEALRGIKMAQLVYYTAEKEEFAEAYAKRIRHAEAKIVFGKFIRHFKLRGWLKFTNRVGGGKCNRSGRICLRWQTDFGTLCHEVAHLYEYNKFGESRHAKRHKQIMARMIRYCQKKAWWADEIAIRLAPKTIEIVTEAEEKQTLILHRQQQITQYAKRLAYFTRLYTNKIKKARRSLAALQRVSDERLVEVPQQMGKVS